LLSGGGGGTIKHLSVCGLEKNDETNTANYGINVVGVGFVSGCGKLRLQSI
jgi:hypothetical protein